MKSDAELIEQTLDGEWRTFAILVRKYESKIYNYTLYMLKNREDAEETAQDVFIKAYKSLHTFRGEALFSTWLLRIAHFECLSKFRRKIPEKLSVDQLTLLESETESPIKKMDMQDRRDILTNALSKLKHDERSVITLFYYHELSIQETVDASGLTESNVKILLHRGRKKLLKILRGMGVKELTI